MKQKINRFLQYNISRIKAAEQFSQQQADFFFKLVPLLLHVNHPELPGFLHQEACPGGIHLYTPEKVISDELIRRYFPATPPLSALASTAPKKNAIHSLKTIGSIGTIAQSAKSDCDYWVSVRFEELGENSLHQLQEKCELIEQWAMVYGIEVHFFLMDIDQARENSFESNAEDESAGSALKLLLKDELFRTHILVAGKIPLWWLIPPGLNEEQYRNCADKFTTDKQINPNFFVDLGYLSEIPKSEIFGACLWQLNKALESPFKSVIKFAYLELLLNYRGRALALFSDKIKCLVTYPEKLANHDEMELALDEIDPYLLLSRDIIDYYRTQAGDPSREQLVRKCLFLKTIEGMDRRTKGTDQAQSQWNSTMAMMMKWKLLPEDFTDLISLSTWSHKKLMVLGAQVHEYLIDTYKRLRDIINKFEEETGLTITSRDIAILGRKLFTFYEKKPNKVDYIRTISAASMGREHVTIHVTRLQGETVYFAFQGDHDQESLRGNADLVIKRDTSLIALITWLIINGIVQKNTALHMTKNYLSLSSHDLEGLARAIRDTFQKVDIAHIPAEQLLKTEQIERALVIINLHREKVRGSKTLHSAVLSQNSYGEYFVHEYDTLAQFKNATSQLLTKHYVSRWNNNLLFYIPPQDEKKLLQTMIGL